MRHTVERRRPAVALRWAGVLALVGLLAACGAGATPTSAPKTIVYSRAELDSVDPGSPIPARPAPDFTLLDQFGQPVRLSQFRGKVVLLAFADSQCTTICPLTSASMVAAENLLGPYARDVALVAVNANPTADAVADVADYSRAHGLMNRWLFLTGSLAQLKAVWRAYGIEVEVLQGAIDHTPALYLIDPSGRERRLFLTSADYGVVPLEAATLAKDAAALLPGHPHLDLRLAKPLGAPILSPRSTVRLPALAGSARRAVTLGPGQTRLVVFFASWAPDAVGELAALNAYAADAAKAALPSPVAVDVAPVEPSLASAQNVAHAATPLYPMAVDLSGRVADAYGVADIPWLVLVSAKGKVLWSHDGWLPVPDLEAALAKAIHR